jgi:glutathione S-transferase
LIDSHIILDYLDNIAPQGRALFPVEEPARHQALKVASLATGMADKAVSLFYEKRLHDRTSDVWVKRCITQITGALRLLEQDRKARPHDHWFGADIGHADIAVAACLRFLVEAHPGLADMDDYPALAAHAARLEEMPVFRKVYQPFIAPA